MKKAMFVLLQLLLASSVACAATDGDSQKEDRVIDRFNFSLYAGLGSEHDGLTPSSLGLTIGYKVASRWNVFAVLEGSCAHYDKDGVRTYYEAPLLGGGVGFRLVDGTKSSWLEGNNIDVQLMLANSVGGTAKWKQTVYDGSVVYSFRSGRLSPIIGFGYRRTVSHTAGLADNNSLYCKVGFRF